jgi:hypothetical protein
MMDKGGRKTTGLLEQVELSQMKRFEEEEDEEKQYVDVLEL